MGNIFDGDIVLDYLDAAIVFRDVALSVDKLKILYTAVDPNGVLTAPEGSIASGPAGTFVNTDGITAWSPIGSGGPVQPAIFSMIGPVLTSQSPPQPVAQTVVALPAGILDGAGKVMRVTYSGGIVGSDGISTLASGLVFGDPLNPSNYLPFGSTLVPTVGHAFSGYLTFTIRDPLAPSPTWGVAAMGAGASVPSGTVGSSSGGGPLLGATPLVLSGPVNLSFFAGFSAVDPANILRMDTFLVEVLSP